MQPFDKIANTLLNLLFPPKCPLCGRLVTPHTSVCDQCAEEVTFICHPICPICGRPLHTCLCQPNAYAFMRNISPLIYARAARRGIHRMKFQNQPFVSTYFGRLMAHAVQSEYLDAGIVFDCVMSVPMHTEDCRRRGYNQAALLADMVACETGVPSDNKTLIKYRRTETQHALSLPERRCNIQGVFRVTRPDAVRNKVILLCDDVMTSGNTLNECAATLLAAGAKAVYCVTATTAILSERQDMRL